jgi:hypothetical protein
MPALDRLQAAMGGEDFAVVPVSIDTASPNARVPSWKHRRPKPAALHGPHDADL